MRHFVSLLLGLIAVPVLWLLVGLGEARHLAAVTRHFATGIGELAVPIALLAAAGVVFGLLATTRISPIGPAVAGLLLVGACVTLLISPEVLRNVPSFELLGVGSGRFAPLPAYPSVGIVLGVVLLTGVFSATRWRAKPKVGQSAPLPPPALPPANPGLQSAVSAPSPPAARPQGPRHILGLLAGVPVGLVAWLLMGFGLHQPLMVRPYLLYRPGAASAEAVWQIALGAGALLVAGLLIGLVASTRTSPLGPAAAALVFLTGYVYFTWNPLPPDALSFRLLGLDSRIIITTPSMLGVSLIVGVGLLMALGSPSRWRKEPKLKPPPDTVADQSAVQIGSATPAGARQPYGEEPTLVAPGQAPADSGVSSDEPTVVTGTATDETTRLLPEPAPAGATPPAAPAPPQPGAVLWPEPPSTQRAEPAEGSDSDSERTARLPGRDQDNAPNPGAPDLGIPGPSGGQNPWADPPTRR